MTVFVNVCVNICMAVRIELVWMSVWTCERLSDTYIYRQTDRQTDKAIFKLKIDI